MKKALYFLTIISLFCGFLSGCVKSDTQGLENYVSELKSEIYSANDSEYNIKANYGYRETPYANDGKQNERIYSLTFVLFDKQTDDAEYKLLFSYGQTEYEKTFKLNPAIDNLECAIEIENFSLKEFTAKIVCAERVTDLTFKSIIPVGTISSKSALKRLLEQQQDLINSYYDNNGIFAAEIHQRIVVKDGKAYWYIGICSKDGKVKALLIDGINGEVLAVREVL